MASLAEQGNRKGFILFRPFVALRSRLERTVSTGKPLEASFRIYCTELLDSYGLFKAHDNNSMPEGAARGVDQRFVERFARHALYHANPQFRIACMEEDARLTDEEAAWDQAAAKAWRAIVDHARSSGGYGKLRAELRGTLSGRRTWLFPEYNDPTVGWEVRKIYRECSETLANRRSQ